MIIYKQGGKVQSFQTGRIIPQPEQGIAKPQIGGTGPIAGREGFYTGEDGRAFSYLHQPPNQMNLTGNPLDDISPITQAIQARNPGADIGTEGYYGPMYEAANRVYEGPEAERVTGIVPEPFIPGNQIPQPVPIPSGGDVPPTEVIPERTPIEQPKYNQPRGWNKPARGGVHWKQGQGGPGKNNQFGGGGGSRSGSLGRKIGDFFSGKKKQGKKGGLIY